MNRVESSGPTNQFFDKSKSLGLSAGKAAIVLSSLVAYRIIGPVASSYYGGKAAYHGLRVNYHWRHSREKDANGELIPGTELNVLSRALGVKNYMNREAQFKPEDISRLKQELKRIDNLKEALESLKWCRGFAICALVGPFVALMSEMDEGGSVEIGCCNCGDPFHHSSPEEMVEYHINKLKREKLPKEPV